MQVLSMIWGILAIFGFFVAFFPCLGSLNWLNIPFSLLGFIISLIALVQAQPDQKNLAIAGIIMCGVAVLGGMMRLLMGGGIL